MATEIQEDAQVILTPELLAGLIAKKCEDDEKFRAELEKDPKATIEKMTGQPIPEDTEIVLCQNEDNVWNIPVPDYTDNDLLDNEMRQMTPDELSSVDGGLVITVGSIAAGWAVVGGIVAAGIAAGALVGLGVTAAAVVPVVLQRKRAEQRAREEGTS